MTLLKQACNLTWENSAVLWGATRLGLSTSHGVLATRSDPPLAVHTKGSVGGAQGLGCVELPSHSSGCAGAHEVGSAEACDRANRAEQTCLAMHDQTPRNAGTIFRQTQHAGTPATAQTGICTVQNAGHCKGVSMGVTHDRARSP